MGKVEEWYIITSVNVLWTDIHHDQKITSWRQSMMLILEAQDKTIDKRCIEKGFKYFETLRKKFFECKIYSEGVNYSFRRGRNQ